MPVAAATHGAKPMPMIITPYLVLVWFLVGFFTGLGWALGTWAINRVLSNV